MDRDQPAQSYLGREDRPQRWDKDAIKAEEADPHRCVAIVTDCVTTPLTCVTTKLTLWLNVCICHQVGPQWLQTDVPRGVPQF